MKAVLVAIVGLVALSSCKKDYSCECRTGEETAVIQTTEIKDKTLKDAKKICDGKSRDFAGVTRVCKLK